MFCVECGTKLVDGAKFCHNCGAKARGGDSELSGLASEIGSGIDKGLNEAGVLAGNLMSDIKIAIKGVPEPTEEIISKTRGSLPKLNTGKSGNSFVDKTTDVDYFGSIESIIDKSPCSQNAGSVKYGSCILTAKRLIYVQKSLGDLSVTRMILDIPEKAEHFDIVPEDVLQISDGRQAAGKSFIFEMYDGTRYDLYMPDRQQWLVLLTDWIGISKMNATA